MTHTQHPWADIHCHTNASDGWLTPTELVEMAHKCGLKGLSITDHDTVAAYAEAIPVAKRLGIRLGIGVEFSCNFEGHDVHLLGYDFELEAPTIKTLCQKHHARRRDRNQSMLEKLQIEGIDISKQELEEAGGRETIGRPHIAQIMVQRGYVTSMKEAFHRYLGEGKRCYVRGETLSVQETIDAIHTALGKAVIAHPQLLTSSFPIDELLAHSFDGIECFYANLSKKSARRWVGLAEKKGWLMSGGSDFHGRAKELSHQPEGHHLLKTLPKSEIMLGCQGVDEATFNHIFKRPLT